MGEKEEGEARKGWREGKKGRREKGREGQKYHCDIF